MVAVVVVVATSATITISTYNATIVLHRTATDDNNNNTNKTTETTMRKSLLSCPGLEFTVLTYHTHWRNSGILEGWLRQVHTNETHVPIQMTPCITEWTLPSQKKVTFIFQ